MRFDSFLVLRLSSIPLFALIACAGKPSEQPNMQALQEAPSPADASIPSNTARPEVQPVVDAGKDRVALPPAPAKAWACLEAYKDALRKVNKGSLTSVDNTRMRLKLFGKACEKEVPEISFVALSASKVGRASRSTYFQSLFASDCGGAAASATSTLALRSVCEEPKLEGVNEYFARVDPGSYLFARQLRMHGATEAWVVDEFLLQVSLNPELDK